MLHHGERNGIRLLETCCAGLIFGEHVECHVQFNAAVRVHPGGIAGFDHDRGKRRLEERWPWNVGARRELVGSIHWHLPPLAEVHAPLSLQGQGRSAIGLLGWQSNPGQPSKHGDAQCHQADLLLLLMIGIEFLIACVEIAGPLMQQSGALLGQIWNRHVDLVDLVEVAHIG